MTVPEESTAAELALSVQERLARVARVAAASNVGRTDPDFRTRAALEHWRQVCPARYANATLESLEELLNDEEDPFPRVVYDEVRAWVDGDPPPGNVVIAGNLGVGKSWLASVLCQATAERYGWRNEFVPLVRMFEEGNQSNARLGGLGTLDRYVKAHCLVIDDVGSGRTALTESQEDRLYLVVNERWLAERVTVITTNLELPELETFIGVRIAERIKDGAIPIKLPGASRRQPGHRQPRLRSVEDDF